MEDGRKGSVRKQNLMCVCGCDHCGCELLDVCACEPK